MTTKAFNPLSLFKQGATGAFYNVLNRATLYQDSSMTTLVSADNDPVGGIKDLSGQGRDLTQSTTTARPLYKAEEQYLLFDLIDDALKVSLQNSTEYWIAYVTFSGFSYHSIMSAASGQTTIPTVDFSIMLLINRALTDKEQADLQSWMLSQCRHLIRISYYGKARLRWVSSGSKTLTLLPTSEIGAKFILNDNSEQLDAFSATVVANDRLVMQATKNIIQIQWQQKTLKGQLSLIKNEPALTVLNFYENSLTGSIDVSKMPLLQTFRCYSNYITGRLDVSKNPVLTAVWVHYNRMFGTLDFSSNPNLTDIRLHNNKFDGFSGVVSNNISYATFQDNLLPQPAVDAILIAFDNAGRTTGILNVSGTGNAAPSATGITAKNNLIAKGWIVTTN